MIGQSRSVNRSSNPTGATPSGRPQSPSPNGPPGRAKLSEVVAPKNSSDAPTWPRKAAPMTAPARAKSEALSTVVKKKDLKFAENASVVHPEVRMKKPSAKRDALVTARGSKKPSGLSLEKLRFNDTDNAPLGRYDETKLPKRTNPTKVISHESKQKAAEARRVGKSNVPEMKEETWAKSRRGALQSLPTLRSPDEDLDPLFVEVETYTADELKSYSLSEESSLEDSLEEFIRAEEALRPK